MDAISLIVSTTFVLASIPVARAAVVAYRLYGRLRTVTCPETAEAAIVQVQVTRALVTKLAGGNDLRLQSCSRWPERKGCDQACASQIGAAPQGCGGPALPRRPHAPQPQVWDSEQFVGRTANQIR